MSELKHKSIDKNVVFVVILLMLTVVSYIFCFLDYKNFSLFFWHDTRDAFMDLFNSIMDVGKIDIVIYPPLALLPYIICYAIIPDAPALIADANLGEMPATFALRNTSYGGVFLLVHFLCFIVPFCMLLQYTIKGNYLKKVFYSMLICFSGIMLWTLQRGNIIIYALLFTMLFVVLYKSEKKWVRFLSYFCLALAFNLKLYPAVFGLILLENRDWKGIANTVILSILIYFISFFICGYNISQIFDIVKNIIWASNPNNVPWLHIMNLSIKELLFNINDLLYENLSFIVQSKLLLVIIKLILLLTGVFSYFFAIEKWQKYFILVALMVYIPNISYFYTAIFFIIPLIAFLNSKSTSKVDYFTSVAFAFLFAFFVIPIVKNKSCEWYLQITLSFLIQKAILFILYVLVFIISLKNFMSRERRQYEVV